MKDGVDNEVEDVEGETDAGDGMDKVVGAAEVVGIDDANGIGAYDEVDGTGGRYDDDDDGVDGKEVVDGKYDEVTAEGTEATGGK